MATKITVKETVQKLKEKNKNPRRIFNKAELTTLVQAVLNDDEYIAKNTKVKQGKFITEDRHLSSEFKKALTDIIKQMGLSTKEALEAVENYRVPKSLAAAMVDAVHHADHIYMGDIGKGIRFLGEGDTVQTIFMRSVDDKEHRVPDSDKKVKVKSHRRLAIKTKVNPDFKTLLQ